MVKTAMISDIKDFLSDRDYPTKELSDRQTIFCALVEFKDRMRAEKYEQLNYIVLKGSDNGRLLVLHLIYKMIFDGDRE